MQSLKPLLTYLADEHWHTQTQILQDLRMDNKQLKALLLKAKSCGVNIRLHDQAYQLEKAIEYIDLNKLFLPRYKDSFCQIKKIYLLEEIDSSNTYLLLKRQSIYPIELCIAEYQSAGRGQFNRPWLGSYGRNLHFSIKLSLSLVNSRGLSLAVGVMIQEALLDLGIREIELKWPNDIYYQGQKLAGVLIESAPNGKGQLDYIIGIGVNLNLSERDLALIDKAATSINTVVQKNLDRNIVLATLMHHLILKLKNFQTQGLSLLLGKWNALDYYRNKLVVAASEDQTIRGLGCGIDQHGHYIIKENNIMHTISRGQLSLESAS